MGYNTEFKGHFKIFPKMKSEHIEYINKFSEIRHMKRDVDMINNISDLIREKVNLQCGIDGEFFVGGNGYRGQECDESIIDYNNPPKTQPGLWCEWVINETNNGENILEWNGGEKFYHYLEWLQYLIDNLFNLWGYTLNGYVSWKGEDCMDRGEITVINNKIEIHREV